MASGINNNVPAGRDRNRDRGAGGRSSSTTSWGATPPPADGALSHQGSEQRSARPQPGPLLSSQSSIEPGRRGRCTPPARLQRLTHAYRDGFVARSPRSLYYRRNGRALVGSAFAFALVRGSDFVAPRSHPSGVTESDPPALRPLEPGQVAAHRAQWPGALEHRQPRRDKEYMDRWRERRHSESSIRACCGTVFRCTHVSHSPRALLGAFGRRALGLVHVQSLGRAADRANAIHVDHTTMTTFYRLLGFLRPYRRGVAEGVGRAWRCVADGDDRAAAVPHRSRGGGDQGTATPTVICTSSATTR